MEVSPFNCSICGDPSRDICVHCTKDTCSNHMCERCRRCSDCCHCDVPIIRSEPNAAEPEMVEAVL